MKKILTFALILLTFASYGQDVVPADTAMHTLPTYSFKYYTADSSVWIYKGAKYKTTKLVSNIRMNQIIDSLGRESTIVHSSGVGNGNTVYVVTGTSANKISVVGGSGFIRKTNSQQGELIPVTWAASPDLYTMPAPAAGMETVIFIGIDYSGGVASAITKTALTDFNWYSNFPLARVGYDGTEVYIVNAYAHAEDTPNHARQYLRKVFGFNRENTPEGTGGLELGATNRQLSTTGGKVWLGFNNYTFSAFALGHTFDVYYRKAGGGHNVSTATEFPNTQYDNGSGTLQDLTTNRYGTLWAYLSVGEPHVHLIYGAVNATSVALAQADVQPTLPDHLTYGGMLIARIIFQKSGAAATLIESAWVKNFSASAVGNHALLSNLQGGIAGQYYHLSSTQRDTVLTAEQHADTVRNAGHATIFDLLSKRNLNNHDSLSTLDERKYQSLTDTLTWGLGLSQTGHVVKVDTASTSILSRQRAANTYAPIAHTQAQSTITALSDSLLARYTKTQSNTIFVPKTLTITATTPITIDGTTSADLSTNRTLAIIPATGSLAGSMSAADKTKLDSITSAGYIPNLYEFEIASDGANTKVVPFTLQLKTAVFYNGLALPASLWSGDGTTTITLAISVRAKDYVKIYASGFGSSNGGGTVTSVAAGLGLSGGTITSSGTIALDTANVSVLSRQRAANTYVAKSILLNNLQDSINNRYRRGDTATVILSRERAAKDYAAKNHTQAQTTIIGLADSLLARYTKTQANSLLDTKRNLNDHDSLSTLQEKNYSSLDGKPDLTVYRMLNNHDSLSTLDERKYQSLTDTLTWGLGLSQTGHVTKVDTASASILSRQRALKEYEPVLGNPATDGYLLSSTALGVRSWIAPATGGGITTLNTLTAATQTFAIGTSGTAPAWSSATSTHTLNIPSAGTATVTAGTISKTEYDTFNGKMANVTPGTSGNVLTSNGTVWTSAAPAAGGSLTPEVISTATNAAVNKLYVMTATLTLTLPASATAGDRIGVFNASGVLTCVIARNGLNIMSLAENLTLDKLNAGFELIYIDATRGWIIL